MVLFTVRKTDNGYILDVGGWDEMGSGQRFGQYCFERKAKLNKAIKELLNDTADVKPTHSNVEVPF